MPVITPETVSLLTPHIIDLIKNVFKSRNREASGKTPREAGVEPSIDSLSRDIVELQQVASGHGIAIAEIAQNVEVKLAKLERQLKWQRLFSLASLVVAVIATGIALAKSA
jgi:hypothetical protein